MHEDLILKIAGIGILVSVVVNVLKKADREDIANLVSLAGVVIVLLMVIDIVYDLFDTIKALFLI